MDADERILTAEKPTRNKKVSNFSVSLIVVIFCFISLPLLESFNLDTNYPLIYEDPQNNYSSRATYFGYSVVMYSNDNVSWIQVSAPRANNTRKPDILEPGLIYRCYSGSRCFLYDYDIEVKDNKNEFVDKKDQQWLGGSMIINPKKNLLAVCAPRWINLIYPNDRLIEGVCYTGSTNSNDDKNDNIHKYAPLVDKIHAHMKNKNITSYNYGLGQAGISAYFPNQKNDEGSELILGAPGVMNWMGSVVILRNSGKKPSISNKQNNLSASVMDKTTVEDIQKHVNEGSYFGYGVAAGKFTSNKLLYAASAPRGYYNHGYVLIFGLQKNKKSISREQKIDFKGDEIGSYFGATLEAADLNNDGYDDLLISAPMLKVPTVYIYNGGSQKLNPPLKGIKTLQGGSLFDGNSRFGLSIAVADLDFDNYKEVLVGGPFAENGRGAIALWKGGPSGLQGNGPPASVYRASDLYPYLRGFGISIASPVDMDRNSYPDVAIGSFLSGHVVVLRGRPVIKLQVSIQPLTKKLLYDSKFFTILYCIKCSSQINLKTEINVNVEISVDNAFKRAYLNGTFSKNNIYRMDTKINTADSNCRELHILLNEVNNNFLDPIELSIKASLINYVNESQIILINNDSDEVEDNFNNRYPVSDPSFHLTNIPFETDCGSDNLCETDLNINIEIKGLTNKFIVGSNDTIQMNITVGNTKEPSYVTQIKLFLPPSTSLARLKPECSREGNNTLLCNIDNPLKSNHSKSIIIYIGMQDVLTAQKGEYLLFAVEALTKSKEINPEDNQSTLKLLLDIEASVGIVGKSSQDEFSYDEIGNEVSGKLVKFSHIYDIQKFGVSPVDIIMVLVKVPYAYKTKKGNVSFVKILEPKGYLDGQPFSCEENALFEEFDSENDVDSLDYENSALIRKKRQLDFLIDGKDNFDYPVIADVKEFNDILKQSVVSENKYNSTLSKLPENRTIEIDCYQEKVLCTEITCQIGPFRRSQSISKLLIKMKVDISAIKNPVMGPKDILVITTEATAQILNISLSSQHSARVSSIFISWSRIKVALWLLILSVILGLFLLMLVIYALTKIGFFDRKKKKELEALKLADENEKIEIDTEWYEESLPYEDSQFEIDEKDIR